MRPTGFEARKKELANRPLIREQAFGKSLDPDPGGLRPSHAAGFAGCTLERIAGNWSAA